MLPTPPPCPTPQALAILFAVSQYCQKHGISTDIADGLSTSDLLNAVVDDNNQQVCPNRNIHSAMPGSFESKLADMPLAHRGHLHVCNCFVVPICSVQVRCLVCICLLNISARQPRSCRPSLRLRATCSPFVSSLPTTRLAFKASWRACALCGVPTRQRTASSADTWAPSAR